MPHFLIKSNLIKDNIITVNDKDLFKHIIKVMRFKKNEKILFLDENEIQYETLLKEIGSSFFTAEIKNSYKSNRKLQLNLNVAQCVLNSDDQISSIKKATELGVKTITPILSDNCSLKENIIKLKIDKWQKIALESVKQCERADVPFINNLSKLPELINNYDRIIVFAEKYTNENFFEYIKENPIDKKSSILIIIGPEGGFSEKEFMFFKDNNIPLITLGNLIYRADTALTAALTTVINGVLYGTN